MIYSINSIFIFSFKFLFTLNNIKIPIPFPARRPANIEPKVIKFCKYSCVKITEPAQLGINPTILAIIGPKIGVFNIKCDIFSLPIIEIIILMIIDIININKNI